MHMSYPRALLKHEFKIRHRSHPFNIHGTQRIQAKDKQFFLRHGNSFLGIIYHLHPLLLLHFHDDHFLYHFAQLLQKGERNTIVGNKHADSFDVHSE